jgi:DNA polymerase-3 subunit alpha
MQLEGMPRNSSTHAAGVVIGDRPLAQLVPLYRDPRSDMPVTQFDMKYVEDAGLIKFDFLGLKTLSVCARRWICWQARDHHRSVALPWDDADVYACCSGATRSACSSWNPKACGARWRR